MSRTRELDEAEEPERGDLLVVAPAAAVLAWRIILIMEAAPLLTAAAPAAAVAPVAARDEQLEREDGEHVDDEPAASSRERWW